MEKCQGCGKKATINLQQNWQRYSIKYDKKGVAKYTLDKEWEGDNNEFWCDECADKEGII
jgi:hypothetical protein